MILKELDYGTAWDPSAASSRYARRNEELFARGAEARYPSPTLTKRILELEQIVGFPLFLRTTQFVEPTEACRQFVEEAKQSIFHAERSLHVARTAERGAKTVLHVGKSRYTDPYIISALNAVEPPLYPNLELCQSSINSQDIEGDVLLGKLDFGIAVGDFDNRKITQLELMKAPFYIVLHEKTSLAGYREIDMQSLHDLSWTLFERYIHPAHYDSILKAAAGAQASPRSIHHVASAEEAAHELYSGSCDIAFLTRAGAWRISRNGLTMRPLAIPDLESSTKLIAKANTGSRHVSEFVRALKRKLRYQDVRSCLCRLMSRRTAKFNLTFICVDERTLLQKCGRGHDSKVERLGTRARWAVEDATY